MNARLLRAFTDKDVLGLTCRSVYPIYEELFHPADAYYAAQIRLRTSQGVSTGLTLMRSRRPGDFRRSELEFIEQAAPGIGTALHAAITLGTAQDQAIVTAADSLGGAAILIGEDRELVSLSPAAEALLQDGSVLTIRMGRVVATDSVAEQALDRAVRLAALPNTLDSRPNRVRLRGSGGFIVANLCPLPRRIGGAISIARVLLTVLPLPPSAEKVASEYGLTPSEAEVAELLTQGCTLREIASKRGIAVDTVRTQLKSVFGKTGTHRQAELVGLLRSLG